jgi:hypothetical protein
MAIPALTTKKGISRATQREPDRQPAIGALHCPAIPGPSGHLGRPRTDAGFQPLHSQNHSVSSERTRVALLTLDDSPADESAIDTLWEENHLSIEREMECLLHSSSNPALRKRILSGVVALSKFYCEEIDDPKAWVARCANLETRRVALRLTN